MTNEGNLLVVDDHEPTRSGLCQLLRGADFTVHDAADGHHALRIAAEERLDAVLLDVMMPGISGLDVCAQLKQQKSTRLIPIVLMTGLNDRAVRLQGLAVGADDFLTKPIDSEELGARVRSLVRMKRLTDALESAEALFLALARFIEARDPTTEGHCDRLARYAVALGTSLQLDRLDLETLNFGGFL